MQRLTSVVRLVVLLTLTSAIGCAGPQIAKSNWMFPWKKSAETKTSLAEAEKSKDDDNPLRKKDDAEPTEESKIEQTAHTEDKPAADDAKKEVEVAEAKAPDPAPKKEAAKKGVVFDQELLAYIDSELKDASPEEASQLFDQLKGLEPNMVRMILKTRRLTKEYGHHASRQTAQQAPNQQTAGPNSQQTIAQNQPNIPENISVGHTNTQQQPNNRYGNNPMSTTQSMGGRTPWNDQGANGYTTAAKPTTGPGMNGGMSTNDNSYGPQSRGEYAAAPANSQFPNSQNGYQSGFNAPQPGYSQQQQYGNPNQEIAERRPFGGANSREQQFPANSQFANNQQTNNQYGQQGMPQQSTLQDPRLQQTSAQDPRLQMSQTVPANHTPDIPAINVGPGGQGDMPQLTSQFGEGVQRQKTEEELRWEQDLQQLISLMENNIANMATAEMDEAGKQRYVEQQVHLRLLYLMAGRPERAFEPVRNVDPAEQEFWSHLFWGMANYFDQTGMPSPADRASQTVAQLQDAVRRMQEKANLRMRNVNFCRKIDNFGNYTRFERDEFSPKQVVLVYAEFDNIRSELTTEGMYRTVLQSRIELLTPDGRPIQEAMDFSPTQDLCRNPRKDYFLNYRFSIPEGLPLGPYVMKLTVHDQLSQKVSTETLNFTVR